jgi:predicted transcriptional regulator
MSKNVVKMRPEIRRRYVLVNRINKTISQIAHECGVKPRTIDRDIAKMKNSGEWRNWWEDEFLRLHRLPTISDTEKLKAITHCYGKLLTRRKVVVKPKTEFEVKLVPYDGAHALELI